MPVSSLIFVVIVAIWAAYLVQHWLRRREDAAATRSVDGFSEAMRVLEKRPILPRTELRTPRPRSYSVTPARVARPTVDVKHAVPAGRGRSPLVARGAEHVVEPSTPEQSAQPTARVPVGQRRIRALLLLAALAWLPASVALAMRGVLLWISVPFAVLTVVAVLVWLRTEARADRFRAAAARGVRRVRRGRPEVEVEEPTASSDDTQIIQGLVSEVRAAAFAAGTVGPSPAAQHVAAQHAVTHEVVAHEVVTRDVVFDVQAVATGAVPTAAEPEQLPEGSWSPVPVPKPTYALKAKAEPRYTESGIPADVFDTPEFADEADELDERAIFARRAASQ